MRFFFSRKSLGDQAKQQKHRRSPSLSPLGLAPGSPRPSQFVESQPNPIHADTQEALHAASYTGQNELSTAYKSCPFLIDHFTAANQIHCTLKILQESDIYQVIFSGRPGRLLGAAGSGTDSSTHALWPVSTQTSPGVGQKILRGYALPDYLVLFSTRKRKNHSPDCHFVEPGHLERIPASQSGT